MSFDWSRVIFIDRILFLIERIGIEQRSNHLDTSGLFSSSFRSIEQKFRSIKNPLVRISLKKFQNLNFHFTKLYSLNSNIIIIIYLCIYLYIQQNSNKGLNGALTFSCNRTKKKNNIIIIIIKFTLTANINLGCTLRYTFTYIKKSEFVQFCRACSVHQATVS